MRFSVTSKNRLQWTVELKLKLTVHDKVNSGSRHCALKAAHLLMTVFGLTLLSHH
jgi:hypothetical protein